MDQEDTPGASNTDLPEVTRVLLERFSAGDQEASAQLLERLYSELHAIARRYMRQERQDHTLRPTALVNEAYLRLLGAQTGTAWKDRAHFMATAARTMRRILVDHARKRLAQKRGGGGFKVVLDENMPAVLPPDHDFIAIHEALERLSKLDDRRAQVIDLRYFGGLSVDETAKALGVSEKTVKNDVRFAKAWLRRELE